MTIFALPTLRTLVGCHAILAACCAAAQEPEDSSKVELERGLQQIDRSLVEQVTTEMKQWCATVGEDVHGVLRSLRRESLLESHPFSYQTLLEPGAIKLDMKHGCAVQEAATLFRAYEITGESAFLKTGLRFCEFLLRAQELTGGYWARTYIVDAAGNITIPGACFRGKVREGEAPIIRSSWLSAEEKTCRLQDHYQSRPFYLLLYAHRLTGERRYVEAARRNADVVLGLQNENGSWPDEWDFSITDQESSLGGNRGVRIGGSYNDDATGDSLRMMIQMYHMTGDCKYVARMGRLGQWLIDTQIGSGAVRGWCQQYDLVNRPVSSRSQEMAAIQNLAFTQFVAPLLTWFYAISGDDSYATLLRETHDWIISVRQPGGWAYQYLADGTPVFSTQFQLYRLDQPQSWPAESEFTEPCRWQIQYRAPVDVSLSYVEHVLKLIDSGGQEALRRLLNGPVKVGEELYMTWRLEAVRRATDRVNIDEIRRPWTHPAAQQRMPRAEIIWPKLQFLYDVRLAKGQIPPSDLLQNTRGFKGTWREEWRSSLEPWHVMLNWTQLAYPAPDWLALPADAVQRPERTHDSRIKRLTADIDRPLFTQVVEDLNRWREWIELEQVQGLPPSSQTKRHQDAPFDYDDQVEPEGMAVDMRQGNAANEVAVLFRAYELLGDRRFLNTGLKFCDFLVQAQLDPGFWARTYIVNPGQPIVPAQSRHFSATVPPAERHQAQPWLVAPESTCRIQDGYQYRAFALLLYAHRLSGDQRYLDASRRAADVIQSLWNENGSWPDEWDFSLPPCEGPQSTERGVRMGGSYNCGATSDCLRMMLQMYHLTADEKYLANFDSLGQWLFDTQIGQGAVRGWCQQYGLDNRPISGRHFEMAVIEPRVFSQYVAPLCAWYYALTGDRRYCDLLRQPYFWLRSVEQTEGWAFAYLPDGSPAFSHGFRVHRLEDTESERTRAILADPNLSQKYTYSRILVQLKCAEQVLHSIESGGREGLCERINGKILDQPEFQELQRAAARRATQVQHDATIKHKWSLPDDRIVRKEDVLPRLQFVFDVLLADGKISPEFLYQMNRGFQWPHFHEKWDCAGDWTSHSVSIEDWLSMPRTTR